MSMDFERAMSKLIATASESHNELDRISEGILHLAESIPMEEYSDEQTGIRMTVEREGVYAEWPRVTLYPPPNADTLTQEEVLNAVKRLVRLIPPYEEKQ